MFFDHTLADVYTLQSGHVLSARTLNEIYFAHRYSPWRRFRVLVCLPSPLLSASQVCMRVGQIYRAKQLPLSVPSQSKLSRLRASM